VRFVRLWRQGGWLSLRSDESGPVDGQGPSADVGEFVAIDTLIPAGSLRLAGVNPEYAWELAEVGASSPPILVDRHTVGL
jgi:hypothetical protein